MARAGFGRSAGRAANGGMVPMVARYDAHERVTGPPLPHLFQRKTGHGWWSQVFSHALIQRMLNDALARAELRDNAGQLLACDEDRNTILSRG